MSSFDFERHFRDIIQAMSSRTWEMSSFGNDDSVSSQRYDDGHSGVITILSWLPNTAILVSACSNCFIKVWNVESRELLHTICGSENNSVQHVSALSWSPKYDRLVAIFNTCVKFWNNADSFSLVQQLNTIDTKGIAWTSCGRKIITMRSHTVFQNAICVWCDLTYRLLFTFRNDARSFRVFSLSRCESLISFSCLQNDGVKGKELLTVANLTDERMGETVCEISSNAMDKIHIIEWSPITNIIATVSSNHVRIRDPETLELLHSISSCHEIIISLSWSPDGTQFVFTSSDIYRISQNRLSFIEVHSYFPHKKLLHSGESLNNTSSVSWIYEGEKIMATTTDAAIQVFDAISFQGLHMIEENSQLINCSAFTEKKNIIAFGGNDRIVLWNLQTNTPTSIIRFREKIVEIQQPEFRKCPQCRKEISSPYGYKGYPDINITCCICYDDFSPIMMTTCGHFLCEICFRNPMVFGHCNASNIDDLENSMRGVSLSPREEEYVPYNRFREEFVVYGRYPNPPESRNRIETIRRKDVIINALKKHHDDAENNRISSQVVMDITFYCDPPREDFPLGFVSPDEQTTHYFRRMVCMIKDIPDWQAAIITLYQDLVRRSRT